MKVSAEGDGVPWIRMDVNEAFAAKQNREPVNGNPSLGPSIANEVFGPDHTRILQHDFEFSTLRPLENGSLQTAATEAEARGIPWKNVTWRGQVALTRMMFHEYDAQLAAVANGAEPLQSNPLLV